MEEKKKPFSLRVWLKYFTIILIGNGFYFGLMPYLPRGARHRGFEPDVGTLVDLWFCLVVFGIFELVGFLLARRKSSGNKRGDQGQS